MKMILAAALLVASTIAASGGFNTQHNAIMDEYNRLYDRKAGSHGIMVHTDNSGTLGVVAFGLGTGPDVCKMFKSVAPDLSYVIVSSALLRNDQDYKHTTC